MSNYPNYREVKVPCLMPIRVKGFAMINFYYCFCSLNQSQKSLVDLESVIVATAPYFEHTASLNYSLCLSFIYKYLINPPFTKNY